jgi:hypothetical protein
MRTTGFAAGAVALLLALGGCGTSTVDSSRSQSNTADTTPPAVAIISPSVSGNYFTTSAAVSLAGSAADNVGVASVAWHNAANGAGGAASGTDSWSAPNITLVSGVNTITVTAQDAAGNNTGATLVVTYNPGGSVSLTGNVDSSLINRSAANAVYIYNGTVTPTGATPPVATTPVTQDNGACTFSYRFSALPAGAYTVAFSSDATTFRGISTVTLPGTGTHDFPPARRLQVGPTRALTVPSAAAAVALAGDVIEIDAGLYIDDIVVWRQSNLTLRGVGGRAHIHSTKIIPFVSGGTDQQNGKGIWVQAGSTQNTTVENIELSGASVADQNGAGIRADGSGLTVCNGYFHDNEDGILGGSGVVLVEYSEFDRNGFGDGQSHNMYFGQGVSLFTLRYSYSHRAKIGHNVKSRAQENRILYNRITDEEGTASYEINLPNAGLSYVIGNLIQQGPNTDNSTIIEYGEEGVPAGWKTELYVVNNTIVNDLHSGRFIDIAAPGTTARFVNNIFAGGGSIASGAGVTSTNNLATSPGFVDSANFDYHLTSASAARNAGVDPGSVGAFSLVPTSQYVQPISREDRPVDGAIDIGAYEFQ